MLQLVPTPQPSAAAAARRRPRSYTSTSTSAACICCSSVHKRKDPRARALALVRRRCRRVLVRHGQSTWNTEGRIQAATSRQMLLSDAFGACFTSPLARSHRTAEFIWQGRDDELIPDPDLREIDLYSFQGLLKHEGKEKYGFLYRQWQKNAANFSIDSHYPVQELWGRAQSCWERILVHQGKSVLVVAHNAVN